MSSEGFHIDGKKISAAVGVVTLFLAMVSGVGFIIRQDYRISTLETQVVKLEDNQQKSYDNILLRIDDLTTKITELTIALGNVQYKQENKPRP
ncbi:hypothetical protein JYP52_01495 [Nitratireductor aquibiodomus]|uniref:hypothetical protein n=1 Tax=Nitratireductor aquibiodomus TaxID=204799 RepID=UPI0019D33239|nr:hypothetical protein [Nitratireductor aquibiodomus]MBN7759797.1 hypothetical protein [Nitratireductor aquibiodomus]